MNRNRITRLLAASGAAVIAMCTLPGTAHAILVTPCTLIGAPWQPPPCIKTDYKKLADIATQNAHEIQKVKDTIETIKQAKSMTDGIVSEVRDLASTNISFSLPNVDTNLGPILGGLKGDIAGYASKIGDEMFAGIDVTPASAQQAHKQRLAMQVDANAEGFAYGVQGVSEAESANTRYANLSKKACKAKDLRADWAANSEIKLEVMNARARQAHLLSAFLRVQAANNTAYMPTSMPKGNNAGTIVKTVIAAAVGIDQSDKVRGLLDVYNKAQNILGALQVVKMTQSVQETLRGVISDYENVQQRKQAKINEFLSYANSWARHSGKCSGQQIVDTTLSRIGAMNTSLANLSTQSIDTLVQSGAFNAQNRNMDVGALLDNDVDPRQFIGTWSDPLHYQNTENLANELKNDDRNGAVSRCIKGDDDNNEFMDIVRGKSYENKSVGKNDPNRYVYLPGINDLILEEAMKKKEVYGDPNDPVNFPGALALLAQAEGTISEENTQQGHTVTTEDTTKQLEQLVAQANELGAAVSLGQDEGSKQRAAEILAQINELLGGGVNLPAVDTTPVSGNGTNP